MIMKSESGRICANFIEIWPIFGPFGLLIKNLILTYENMVVHGQTFIYTHLAASKSYSSVNSGQRLKEYKEKGLIFIGM